MLVRIARAKVGHRQAPNKKPSPSWEGFFIGPLPRCLLSQPKTHPAGISIGAADPPCVGGRALHGGVFQCRLTWALAQVKSDLQVRRPELKPVTARKGRLFSLVPVVAGVQTTSSAAMIPGITKFPNSRVQRG